MRAATAILGYLNFSDGSPDPRWQTQFHDAYVDLCDQNVDKPAERLIAELLDQLHSLHQDESSSAFRDINQARTTLQLLPKVIAAYREHHKTLLAHLSEDDFARPFFLIRVLEAILAQGPTNNSEEEVIAGTMRQLNDYVGYRPIAVLETRPKGEPYSRERFRPVPLYLRGVGVAHGRHHEMLQQALNILRETDEDLLHGAHLDLELLDEIALDVRAYDHDHPANMRPNYVFGEWDPHHIDNSGNYRRFILRGVILEAALKRIEEADPLEREEMLFDSAAVIAGTILMATAISGRGPTAHDSSASLAVLIPSIVQSRDQFYERLLARLSGPRQQRLLQEQRQLRQPFGAARQYLNACLARQRAAQLQQRALTLLFAEMGYPEASRMEAQRIPTPSVRFLSEIPGRLSTANTLIEQDRIPEAIDLLPEIQQKLDEGIECGAIVDPWNILGFQGLFPLSAAQEDSLPDPRVDELLHAIDETFTTSVRLCSSAAASGQTEQAQRVLKWLGAFVEWWDRFATVEVSDVQRVLGEEALRAAQSVTTVLSLWHKQDHGKADLAFWREHLDSITTSQALAAILEAQLEKQDYLASLAMLISWIGNVEQAPLEEGPTSFHTLAQRWIANVMEHENDPKEQATLIRRCFAWLEANAEEYWDVPVLPGATNGSEETETEPEEEEEDNLYQAAWEDVTYQDSTSQEGGSVVDGSEGIKEEPMLEQEADALENRLRLQSTIARLWQMASYSLGAREALDQEVIEDWTQQALKKREALLTLIDQLTAQKVAQTLGSYDSIAEIDRQQQIQEHLLYATINTCVDMSLAFRMLRSLTGQPKQNPAGELPWEGAALLLEQSIFRGDVEQSRKRLKDFVRVFRQEELLMTSLSDGGEPRHVYRVRLAQTTLRRLLACTPRLGLLYETQQLLKLAQNMEKNRRTSGKRGITELAQFFETAFIGVIEQVVNSSTKWEEELSDEEIIELLNRVTAPFLVLWVEHSRTVQLSPVEAIRTDGDWKEMVKFIKSYGRDFFHPRFMTVPNLRGILQRGVAEYLQHLRERPDALARPTDQNSSWEQPTIALLEDIREGKISESEAARWMEIILQTILAHYQEHKDFSASTTQSDYGENLYVLLEFLRVKAGYDRRAWQIQPLILAHEVLARQNQQTLALLWEQTVREMTNDSADQYLQDLSKVEEARGARLRTIRDRLEERFIAPLALDRLRALVRPAMLEAKMNPNPSEGPFSQFHAGLEAYAEKPTGVGLDVPMWLKRLEDEVESVRSPGSDSTAVREVRKHVQQRELTLDQIQTELKKWEQS